MKIICEDAIFKLLSYNMYYNNMKLWKIAALLPYLLVAAWVGYLFLALPGQGAVLGGIIVAIAFASMAVYALAVYTVILAIALIMRWLILNRRKH